MKIKNLASLLSGLLAVTAPALASAQAAATDAASVPVDFSAAGLADNVESDNLSLHTLQRKQYSDSGLHEVVLYPAVVQLNTKFTSHYGVGGQYLFHFHENFAIQAMAQYFYVNQQVAFADELVENANLQPAAASSLTLKWAATGGFEVTPIYGKFAFFDDTIAHFGIVLSGGAGFGDTRVQLTGPLSDQGRLFGDTGLKFVGQVGAGFRIRFNENFVMRLEFRDLVYTAKVDTINGCSLADIDAMDNKRAPGAGCRGAELSERARGAARSLVEEPSSDVLNNLSVFGGLSYTF